MLRRGTTASKHARTHAHTHTLGRCGGLAHAELCRSSFHSTSVLLPHALAASDLPCRPPPCSCAAAHQAREARAIQVALTLVLRPTSKNSGNDAATHATTS